MKPSEGAKSCLLGGCGAWLEKCADWGKDWSYFEKEEKENSLVKASKVLTRDVAKRIESKEADVYQVLSILRCGAPCLGKDADYKGSLAYTLFKCLVCAGIQTIVAPLVVIAKFYETLSQDQFELCQQDWKNDWIGKVVSFAFAWYIFVQFLVAMRNATDEQNAASYLIFSKNTIPNALGTPFIWGYTVNLISECYTALASLFLIYLTSVIHSKWS